MGTVGQVHRQIVAGALVMKHLLFKSFIAGAMLIMMSACVSTRTVATTNEFKALEKDAIIVLMEPDVQLSFLRAAGMREVRADWTETGRANILKQIETSLAASDHTIVEFQSGGDVARENQLIRLHEAVGSTILTHRIFRAPLPSKKNKNDWSLGPGVQVLKGENNADYALFLYARGAYASAGRQALGVLVAVAGGGAIGTGDQQAFASLVDLNSGDVVWFNVAMTGQGTDMRKEEGSASLVKAILKGFPLRGEDK